MLPQVDAVMQRGRAVRSSMIRAVRISLPESLQFRPDGRWSARGVLALEYRPIAALEWRPPSGGRTVREILQAAHEIGQVLRVWRKAGV